VDAEIYVLVVILEYKISKIIGKRVTGKKARAIYPGRPQVSQEGARFLNQL